MKCNDGTVKQGGGRDEGLWDDWEHCPAGTFICGLQVRMEEKQGTGVMISRDDTALNQVMFACCKGKANIVVVLICVWANTGFHIGFLAKYCYEKNWVKYQNLHQKKSRKWTNIQRKRVRRSRKPV